MSVMVRLEDGTICHSYSAHARRIEALNGALFSNRRPDARRDPFCHKRGGVCRTLGTGWSLCLGRPEAGPERRCDGGGKGAVSKTSRCAWVETEAILATKGKAPRA